MRTYELTLEERSYWARIQKERYWRDADFRLKCINRDRQRKGKPLIASLDEIAPSRVHHSRDGKGRFVPC